MNKGDGRALQASAKERTQTLLNKLSSAMKSIEADIEANDGLYPYNKGRATQAELCRRAGIRPSVLQGPTHKDTTLVKVNQWLKEVQKELVTGHRSVRRTVTKRANDWNQRYKEAAHFSNLYHLQMVSLRNQLQEAEKKVATLEEENARLQEAVSDGLVVRLPDKKG